MHQQSFEEQAIPFEGQIERAAVPALAFRVEDGQNIQARGQANVVGVEGVRSVPRLVGVKLGAGAFNVKPDLEGRPNRQRGT